MDSSTFILRIRTGLLLFEFTSQDILNILSFYAEWCSLVCSSMSTWPLELPNVPIVYKGQEVPFHSVQANYQGRRRSTCSLKALVYLCCLL